MIEYVDYTVKTGRVIGLVEVPDKKAEETPKTAEKPASAPKADRKPAAKPKAAKTAKKTTK